MSIFMYMDAKLDRQDLFNLLSSVRPEGILQGRCAKKRYGLEEYGRWRWRWTGEEFKKLSDKQLWDLYEQCKQSVIFWGA